MGRKEELEILIEAKTNELQSLLGVLNKFLFYLGFKRNYICLNYSATLSKVSIDLGTLEIEHSKLTERTDGFP
jgi:hypothetical protein